MRVESGWWEAFPKCLKIGGEKTPPSGFQLHSIYRFRGCWGPCFLSLHDWQILHLPRAFLYRQWLGSPKKQCILYRWYSQGLLGLYHYNSWFVTPNPVWVHVDSAVGDVFSAARMCYHLHYDFFQNALHTHQVVLTGAYMCRHRWVCLIGCPIQMG